MDRFTCVKHPASSASLCWDTGTQLHWKSSGHTCSKLMDGEGIQSSAMAHFPNTVMFLVTKEYGFDIHVHIVGPIKKGSNHASSGTIPFTFHVDGAEVYRDTEFNIWSCGSYLASGDVSSFILCVVPSTFRA